MSRARPPSAASSSLGSWVSTAIAVAGSIGASLAKATSGQATITSSAAGKRSAVAKRARGSTTNGRHPASLATSASCAAKSMAPTIISRGGGATTSTNSVAPVAVATRPPLSVQSASGASLTAAASRRASRACPCGLAVESATQQLRADARRPVEHRDDRRPRRRAHRRTRSGLQGVRSDRGLHPHRRSHRRRAARRPTPARRRCRSAAAAAARLPARPRRPRRPRPPRIRRTPPPPPPRPPSTAILVPTGWGADRCVDDRRDRDARACRRPRTVRHDDLRYEAPRHRGVASRPRSPPTCPRRAGSDRARGHR